MAEYFNRDELIREIISDMTVFIGDADAVQRHDEQCNYAISCIENAPVVDVAPVVHGRWVFNSEHWTWDCSNCKCWVGSGVSINRYNFCPNCGAKMDGRQERV